jgi:hypothetical protein
MTKAARPSIETLDVFRIMTSSGSWYAHYNALGFFFAFIVDVGY